MSQSTLPGGGPLPGAVHAPVTCLLSLTVALGPSGTLTFVVMSQKGATAGQLQAAIDLAACKTDKQ